ncbi:MAG: endonuclease domain-containing protein [Saprospiraceae bacterium]|nr:endonuclease domain-containing protein [Saprospiraceae bacterium]
MEKASPSNNYHYNKNLKQFARDLRNCSTKAEILLWDDVLKKSYLGYPFLRQRPVLRYIADFICLELMLIIEVDGMTHDFSIVQQKDRRKQKDLEAVGFTVLRFSDFEVLERRDEVAQMLRIWIQVWEIMNGKQRRPL